MSSSGVADAPVATMVVDDRDVDVAYRRLYPSLFRTAYLLVDDRELAEEVVQDAFAAALPRWARLDVPEASRDRHR